MARLSAAVFALVVAFAATTLGVAAKMTPPGVEVTLVNDRLDRTRVTVMTRSRAVLVRRRLMPLSDERITVRLTGPTDLRFVAHDEGFNRFLSEDMLLNARPGDRYVVSVIPTGHYAALLSILPARSDST
jgi:hypothetical protein